MGIAEGMKSITENIVASYETRVKALSDLASDTRSLLGDARRILKGFAQERKKISEEQAMDLAHFVEDLSRDIGNKLKAFHNLLKQMHAKRLEMSEELKAKLSQEVKGIKNDVREIRRIARRKVRDFAAAHAEMSEALKKNLSGYVGDIVKDVRQLLKGFGEARAEVKDDLKKASRTWFGMAAQMAKSRKSGGSAAEKISMVKEAVAKRKRGKRGRKRGRKKR